MNINLCIFILRCSQERCSGRDKFAFDRIMIKIHFCVLSKPVFPHLINFKMCGLQFLECRVLNAGWRILEKLKSTHLKGAEVEKH